MSEPRAVALNVGANTNEPGFRGPVDPDGRFAYVPIPESADTTGDVPTYGDLAPHVAAPIPEALHDRPVHLDPEFPEYPRCERYTYGDDYGVKARPLLDLAAGDYVFFYATLSVTAPADWLPPEWGAFVIGHFRLARDPLSGEAYADLDAAARRPFSNNAHVKRDPVDAEVFLLGDPEESALYDRAYPLSEPSGGTDAGDLVTAVSSDSGKGPWWRRPLRYDSNGAARLVEQVCERAHPTESYQR
ncbi:hypothetical protein ACKVMT_11715 [Halobacteriales archaeon Cl-PHB]